MKPDETEVRRLLEVAKAAYESGDLQKARRLVCMSLNELPDYPRGMELLGLIDYSQGRYESSIAELEAVSVQVPLSIAAQVCLAHGYGRVGRHQLSKICCSIC